MDAEEEATRAANCEYGQVLAANEKNERRQRIHRDAQAQNCKSAVQHNKKKEHQEKEKTENENERRTPKRPKTRWPRVAGKAKCGKK